MAMSSGATPLHLATQNDHLEVVRLLIQLGADMDRAGGETGTTPLHAAAFKGHLGVPMGTMFEERFDGVNENLSVHALQLVRILKQGEYHTTKD